MSGPAARSHHQVADGDGRVAGTITKSANIKGE
jgi:hypothetical protein